MSSGYLGMYVLMELAFRFYYIYAFVPASFLSYPDVSPKLGIPASVFGIACVLLFWLGISVIVGLIHAVLHGCLEDERKSESGRR